MGQAFSFQRYPFTPLDATTMAERVRQYAPATDAEALKLLRSSFPECSLSMRVAALDMLLRRRSIATHRSA
jgi:hypothetical protein